MKLSKEVSMLRNYKNIARSLLNRESLKKKKINGIEHGLVKWIGYSDKFNEWLPVSKINLI